VKFKSVCQDADALHKYAAGNRYPEKSDILDVCGSGGFDQYVRQSQKFGYMGWIVRVTGIISVAAVLYVSCHVRLLYLHAGLFSEKRIIVYYPLFWIFLIVLIVVTFAVWMAPILEPYNVPNFNGVDKCIRWF
jgi:hypothetical protein